MTQRIQQILYYFEVAGWSFHSVAVVLCPSILIGIGVPLSVNIHSIFIVSFHSFEFKENVFFN